jgi:hypothetical protein
MTGISVLLFVLLSLFQACTNPSVKSVQHSRDDKNQIPQVAVHLIAEQNPNGIYWGLRDTVTGKLVLGYKFEKIWNFEDGFAPVLLNGKYGLVNRYGKIVIRPGYQSAGKMDVKCGCIEYEDGNGPIVVVDTNDRVIVPMTTVTDILPCQKRIILEYYQYGMVNFNNDTILPFKFASAHLLPEGFCVASTGSGPKASDEDLYGLYDLNGKQVLPQDFEYIDGFYCGRAIVKRNGKYGVIDETGKELFYTDYGSINRYTNDYALVETNYKNGGIKAGIINKDGKVVVPAIYQDVSNFREGLAAIEQNQKYGFVDTTGKIVVQFKYDQVQPFESGIAKVWIGWKYVGYVNSKGKEIIPPDFEAMDQANLKRYYNKFIIGLKNSVQHVFHYSGKEVAILNYETVNEFSEKEKSFVVSKNNKYGVLDSNFRVKIPAKYESLDLIFPDKIAARQQGKIGFMNDEGKALSAFKYDSIEPFQDQEFNPYENGLAKVGISGKKGLMNSYGKIIIPIVYDEIEGFSYGLAVVKRNGKYGFVNVNGKEIIPAIYSKADAYDGYSAKVTLKGKAFQINRSGKRVEEDME